MSGASLYRLLRRGQYGGRKGRRALKRAFTKFSAIAVIKVLVQAPELSKRVDRQWQRVEFYG